MSVLLSQRHEIAALQARNEVFLVCEKEEMILNRERFEKLLVSGIEMVLTRTFAWTC